MTPSSREGSLSIDCGPNWGLVEQRLTVDQFAVTDKRKERYLFDWYSVQAASRASVQERVIISNTGKLISPVP